MKNRLESVLQFVEDEVESADNLELDKYTIPHVIFSNDLYLIKSK
jgi:hypothetical protein